MYKFCDICKRLLDNPYDPNSLNCGGTCRSCMAAAGDTDCIRELQGEYDHTQLPWDDYVANGTNVYIDSPENPEATKMSEEPNACKNVAMLTGPDAKANAAFIKKACNSYYEMLRALRTIQKELDDTASWDKCGSAYQRITEAIAIAEEDE